MRRMVASIIMVALLPVASSHAQAGASADSPSGGSELGATMNADAKSTLADAVAAYGQAFETKDRQQRLRLFRRAEILFSKVIEQLEPANCSADLFVNLGNAALGAERTGPAIVAYQKAIALDRDHRRATQNLEHARSLLPRWVPRPESESAGFGSLFAGISRMPRREILGVSALLFLVATILLAAAVRWQKSLLRNLAFIPAAIWAVMLAYSFLASPGEAVPVAVVVLPETIARAADSINAPSRFDNPLPSGAEAQVIEDRVDWLRVRLYDGRDAWLPASSVELVSA